MSRPAESVASSHFRLALPPSVAPEAAERARASTGLLDSALQMPVEIDVAEDYRALTRKILDNRCDAAWAPPYVCARVEAMGGRILLRGVRNGRSTYRAALVARAGEVPSLDRLIGLRAAWVDPDSVGGHLLATAHLKARGLDAATLFIEQRFVGSYRAAVEALIEGRADVTSVFVPHGGEEALSDALSRIFPGGEDRLGAVLVTDEVPNDGLAIPMGASPERTERLQTTFLGLQDSEDGRRLLQDVFDVERFELAPRMGYRALYRVAQAIV